MIKPNIFRFLIFIVILVPASFGYGQRDLARMRQINPQMPAPMEIDEERVAANGIRRIEGKNLVLYTDLREQADIVELAEVFDKAVPLWCEYFSIDIADTEGWQVNAFVIGDKKKFCLLYTSPSPRDKRQSRMPSSA